MRTEDLIRALAADTAATPAPPRRAIAMALAAGAAVTALLFFALLGLRGDIATAMTAWRFGLKLVVTSALIATALFAAIRLSDPLAPPRAALAPVLAVPALLAIGAGVEMSALPHDEWAMRWIGKNSLVCLTTIPVLALAPLGALLYAMRSGAPSSPSLAGAAAGLLASGSAAFLYATHCTDDSPLFVATWYPIAILAVTAAGALIGRKVLRW
ncbi:MAG: DUF1109 domain-containing protein [Hyphomicrobiaceae bacterium]|nr:DUF1109 domain-containing protein [Hyphomicrobiaceae bacterium]